MAGRGGVHISYLIVTIVLCLGLIGALVKQNSEFDKAQQASKESKQREEHAKENAKKLQQELDIARKVIHGNPDNKPEYTEIETKLPEVGQKISDSGLQTFPVASASMYEVALNAGTALDHQKNRAETEIALRKAKEAELKAAEAQREELRATLQASIQQARNETTTLQNKLDVRESEFAAEVSKLKSEMNTVIEDKDARIAKAEKELWLEKSRLLQASERIAHLEQQINREINFDQVDPDGEIVLASSELGYGWIDIGNRDRVTRGLIFDVFEYSRGGVRRSKGRAEVLEVEKDQSKVRITAIDELNPIGQGDKITSPFYDKNEKPVFVIAGERMSTNRLSIEELKKKIADYGGTIEDGVRIETTYLIALPGYEETQAYKTARELKVTVLRERELLQFFDI